MSPEATAALFALGAAVSWGLSSVFVRLGVGHIPTTTGTLVSLFVGLGITGGLVLLLARDDARAVGLSTLAAFSLVGVLHFLCGRYMNFLSIQHLGVARAVPVTAASPVFAALIAVVFTGETLDPAAAAGTALVLIGIYVTLRSAAPHETAETR